MPKSADITGVLSRFHVRLGELGLKSTRQRDAIVETFFRLDRHVSVEELLAVLRLLTYGAQHACLTQP